MKSTSSIGIDKHETVNKRLKPLMIISAISCSIILLWILFAGKVDPYIEASLTKQGSIDKGSRLFRMNCVGCHGISAQGLVGPELSKVTSQLTDERIINQVVKGLTPPMPSFEMESQSMADLLAYLHSLNQG